MAKVKPIYEFTINKLQEVVQKDTTTNEAGDTVEISKKVQEPVPHKFCLSKPSRLEIEEAELYLHVEIGKGLQAGLMSRALLAKRFMNDGGTVSEPEREKWSKQYVALLNLEVDIQKRNMTPESERSDEEKKALEEAVAQQSALRQELQSFEVQQQSLFEITAEARARTKTVFWWLVTLLHEHNEQGVWEPFFDGETIKARIETYDEMEDEDIYPDETDRKFFNEVKSHAMQAVALYYYGRASSQEDFDRIIAEMK